MGRLRTVGRRLLFGWDSMIATHERLTTPDDLLVCTFPLARSCPIHGTCSCGLRPAEVWDCRLHSPLSTHGIEHEADMS